MIRIITDSAADFESQELERLNISCIPLAVRFGTREFRDGIDLTKSQFYDLLMAGNDLPKTSQASPQILLDLFENSISCSDEAIYITLSSPLSGTYQSAIMAKNLADSSLCYVVDGRNATGGQRILVEYAVKLRDEGKSATQIVEALKGIRSRVVLYACIDTLEYLYKGGRISQTAYKLGTLSNIKPVITVESDGSIGIPAKTIGMRKGMDYLCKQAQLRPADPQFPFYVMYTNNRTVAKSLVSRLEAYGITVADKQIIQVGAAIGSHIGPDACGLVYVAK